MLHRFGWAMTGALALLAVLALARALEAGSLDPPGPVGSTMRSLDELLPSWDRKLTAAGPDYCNSQRFQCVLPDATYPDGAAVLDRETGLVWERVPSDAVNSWDGANVTCTKLFKGGRQGWRLPAVDELASLLDSDSSGPFNVTGTTVFWTASRYGTGRWIVDISGIGSESSASITYTVTYRVWCVRGGGFRLGDEFPG